MTITRLLNCSMAVVSAALLLAGCKAGSDTTPSANESKQPGGLLSALRPDPVIVPKGRRSRSCSRRRCRRQRAGRGTASWRGSPRASGSARRSSCRRAARSAAGSPRRFRRAASRLALASPSPSTRSSSRVRSTPSAQERSTSPPPTPTRRTPRPSGSAQALAPSSAAIVNGRKGAAHRSPIGGAAGTGVVLINTGKEVGAGQPAAV